ncbi:MAG TPA: endonuclease [Prolixibacteraceae bacterium]|nr:endonuclease [Prolixibacteraceae bacterium]
MTAQDVIDSIGLDRATLVNSESKRPLDSESVILDELKEKEFEIDSVYFNTDENGNSFPAVFLKKVTSFDEETFKTIAEVHRKIWNYKKVLFLYIYSETEIRIYNCSEKPLIKTKGNFDYERALENIEIKKYLFSDKQQLEELNKLFSRIAIDTGIIWTLEEAQFIRDKINLQKRVDAYLVKSFVNTTNFLKDQGLDTDVVHKVILRSLFLLYLEDRGAAGKDFYNKIKNGTESYLDILDDAGATYELYKKLAEHFNGNVFTIDESEKRLNKEQLHNIKTCLIRGREKNDSKQLFDDDWKQFRLFNFKIIQIELLSEIYENFLAETDPTLKENSGTYYTPPSLVEFILNEKLPVNSGEKEYNVKILDPSCGSGIFLVESFKRLVRRYENANNLDNLSDFDTLVKLLKNNIYGIEIHPQAIKVAAFSLYLALVDKLDPKNLWQDSKNYRLPYLINDPKEKNEEKKGRNLFCRDTISDLSSINELQGFQMVVGNPPFGKLLFPDKDKLGKQKNIREYCNNLGFAKEMVLPFLHKATDFAPKGEIALIFNTKVLTNTGGTFQKFREWLFGKCYVERVYNFSILRKVPESFGGQLFGDATGPISIVFFQKEQPASPSDTIIYYAPKTYIKSNVIEGLSIDSTDVKYLPREECKKPDTKIWKIAMWGGMNDWELIKGLLGQKKNVGSYLRKNGIEHSVGLQPLNKSTKKPIVDNDISKMKFIRPERIERFYTDESDFSDINTLLKNKETIKTYLNHYSVETINDLPSINVFRRITGKNVFSGPMLLSKEGFKNNLLCFSFIENTVAYNSTVLGFRSDNKDKLRFLSGVLNSKLSTYFLLLISNSWGIERERIKPNEIYKFPIVIEDGTIEELNLLHTEIENRVKSSFLKEDFADIERKINKLVFNIYKINSTNKQLIEDFITYSVDLFHKQGKSIALHPVSQEQIIKYAEIFSSELNDFLEDQEVFANATVYRINPASPLMMIKISHQAIKKEIDKSNEIIDSELKKIDQPLFGKKAPNIYFRKKLNYKKGDDIYIIRPNQRRFWSQSMALEDASELILEILNGEDEL